MRDAQHYDRIPFEDTTLPIRINYDSTVKPADIPDEDRLTWHEQLELIYLRKGEAAVYYGSRMVEAKTGDVILMNPFEVHQVVHTGSDVLFDCVMIDASMYCSGARDEKESRLLDYMDYNRLGFENRILGDQELTQHIDSLCRELKNREFMYELAVRSHVFGLLVCLLRQHVRSERSMERFAQNMERYDRIRPAVQMMKQRMSERITLTELAETCHMSSSHFCRMFRQITGVAPVRYLLNLRLQEAATMLRRTDKPVTQVAFEVGFDDSGYFSKKFREQFGMTPTKAKKSGNGE